MAKLRRMLTSDAIPVTPIRPIPDERQRRSGGMEPSEDAVRRNTRATGSDGRDRTRATGEARQSGAFQLGESQDVPPNPVSLPPSLATGPTTGFLTQSIAQEAMGSGLHIEPWDTAISAYRRAASGRHEPLVSNVSV